MPITITLNVLPETSEEAAKAVEVLARAATGLGFEGMSVSISVNTFEEENEN